MLQLLGRLIAMLALVCAPLAAVMPVPVHAVEMADCGGGSEHKSEKASMVGQCHAGCAIVIPADPPGEVRYEMPTDTYELPPIASVLFVGEVATPPPKRFAPAD